jgi:hypothetical protein
VSGRRKAFCIRVPSASTNQPVLRSVHKSSVALKHAVCDVIWRELGSKSEEVQRVVQSTLIRFKPWVGTAFLQPFSDLIHHMEAGCLVLAQCYQGIMHLDKHTCTNFKKWHGTPRWRLHTARPWSRGTARSRARGVCKRCCSQRTSHFPARPALLQGTLGFGCAGAAGGTAAREGDLGRLGTMRAMVTMSGVARVASGGWQTRFLHYLHDLHYLH